MKRAPVDQATYYKGIPTVRYDLVKEFVIALVVVGDHRPAAGRRPSRRRTSRP